MSSPTNTKNKTSFLVFRLSECAGMTAGLGRGLALEPRDEGLNGELLWERAGGLAAAVRRSRRGRGSGRGWGGGLLSLWGSGSGGRRRRGRCRRRSRRGAGGLGRSGRSGPRARARAGAHHRWARERVHDGRLVGVEEDTGTVSLVERSTDNTLGEVGSGAGDLDVQALRVGLGAVGVAAAVQSDDLMAEDVLASLEVRWDSYRPCEVLANQLDGSPLAVLVTVGLDLGPLELLLVDRGEVTSVGSDVCQDGADVRFGPCVPVEVDYTAGRDLGHRVFGAIGAALLVADDVGGVEGVGFDEARVKVLGVPTNVLGGSTVALLGVVVVEQEALGKGTVDCDTGGDTVGRYSSCKGSDGAEGRDCFVHFDRL